MKVFWIALLSIALLLSACAAPQGTGSTDGEAPVTGADTPAGAEPTQGTGGDTQAGAPGACVNVDAQQLATTGQVVYEANCAGCHGAQGEGQGDFPALAGSANVTVDNAVALISAYFAVPSHPKEVSTDDIAAVLTYVRSAFGNDAPAICPEVVLENRPAQ